MRTTRETTANRRIPLLGGGPALTALAIALVATLTGSAAQAARPADQTAAARFGWGKPLPASDEFGYTGAPDPRRWSVYGKGGRDNCWPGHAGNGRRCASANKVADGYLRQTGLSNGDTAGIASRFGQKYGRWEVRARMAAAGGGGRAYHPVLITWPDSDKWPQGAEYDFLENNIGDRCAEAFLHYPNHQPRRQEHAEKCGVDLTRWHNYGFEWTTKGLVGYLDGAEWFRFGRDGIQNAPGPMHLTVQLDNFHGRGMQKAYFDVDWARVYPAR